MRVTSRDGTVLALHDLGGKGPPLVLSHGSGFHGRVLAPMTVPLRRRFHCWALDFRGHGDSEDPATDIGEWDRLGADALAVADALGLQRAIGFGHSMGGTALLMAERERPGTFAGLALFEPIAFPHDQSRSEGPPALAALTRRRRSVFESRDEAYDNYASKPPLSALAPESLQAYVDHGLTDRPDGAVELRCDPEQEARIFEGGVNSDMFEHLGDIGCPVLVLAGSPEENPPGMIAPVIAGALPHGHVRVLPQLSHFGPMQDPLLVAGLVVDFVDALPVDQ